MVSFREISMFRLMGRTLARQDSNSSLPATPENRQITNIPFLKICQLIKQIKRTSQFPFLKNFPCSVIDATNIDSPIPCEESETRNEILRRFTFHAKDKDHNHTRTSFEIVYH